jgi:hypothetical protein
VGELKFDFKKINWSDLFISGLISFVILIVLRNIFSPTWTLCLSGANCPSILNLPQLSEITLSLRDFAYSPFYPLLYWFIHLYPFGLGFIFYKMRNSLKYSLLETLFIILSLFLLFIIFTCLLVFIIFR